MASDERPPEEPEGSEEGARHTIPRRRFLGYLIAAPTLVAGAQLGLEALPQAAAAPRAGQPADLLPALGVGTIPTVQPVDFYDLSDALKDAALPTNPLITVTINKDGTASFALPRAEVGQGITTASAMVIADELGLAVNQVHVTLADARPELLFNQLTGGSVSMQELYTPMRVAAALARGALLQAAAAELGGVPADFSIVDGVVSSISGASTTVGQLAPRAAVTKTSQAATTLKAQSAQTIVGTPHGRIDALDIVTGRKQFAMDIQVPGAMPTMIARAPTINGQVESVANLAQVKAMPGITDVLILPHSKYIVGGVAVRGRTFGQCIDAVDALQVTWGPGSGAGKSDQSVAADLAHAEIPQLPPVNLLVKTIEQKFTFAFRPGDPLETNCAVADVRASSATIWSSLKSPIWAQGEIANMLGLPVSAVTVHVAQGGGSFGRHLFCDAAFEAAAISKAMGKPVKLMWARTDNFRQGRVHPMTTSNVRISYLGNEVLSLDQRQTCVATDFTQGFGDAVSAAITTLPGVNSLGFSESVFTLSANVPYNFGLVTQLLNEIYPYNTLNTSSVRNVYSPNVCTAIELMVDQVAKIMGLDPYQFRRKFVRDPRMLAVLDKAAAVGQWGRTMPANTAQAIAVHHEYKSYTATLMEIDNTPATVNRKIRDAYTGPRITKAVVVTDPGLVINPLGYEAMMMGGTMDGIAQALTYSLHLSNGHYLEGSWDNAYYTRQWNTPFELHTIVMPTDNQPGGAGEHAVSPGMAAAACAYARVTGTLPTSFPINHNKPLGFTPYPTVPPLPESPTDGFTQAF
jgi:isoquinoline 1-oxidoreductase beta subunit